jgi:hypothetical protein
MIVKICSKCKKEKSIDNYGKHKLGKDGIHPTCTSCRTQIQKANRYVNGYPYQIKYKYGITIEEYNSLINIQNHICPICTEIFDLDFKSMKTPCIDHDHKTGKIRGILCRSCNIALGHTKEDIQRLKNLILYIEKYNGNS